MVFQMMSGNMRFSIILSMFEMAVLFVASRVSTGLIMLVPVRSLAIWLWTNSVRFLPSILTSLSPLFCAF
ncbi:hypothetical protein ES703_116851 [subsurface metagenome]